MATVVSINEPAAGGAPPAWVKRYPPLLTLVVALAIAIIVLPSSLNLPQANPATTLELAPVPPTDEKAPPIGNLNQLGLGQSSAIEGSGAPGAGLGGVGGLPGQGGQGIGRPVGTKKCVKLEDGRLHQTEDPLSPPCVAYFDGNNGGATYQGVASDEIRIVFYEDGASFYTPTARGTDNMPTNQLIDLDDPPKPGEVGQFFTRRYWEKYFEDRFQTYNRHPHFFIYYGGNTGSPEDRQADASQVYAQVKPFATISSTGLSGGSDDFLEFMAQRGVLNFGSLSGRPQSFFNRFPKLIWGYPPSTDQMAKNFISAVCRKVVPYPVSFAGANNINFANGQPRKLGLIFTNDNRYPALQDLAVVVRNGINACGGNIVSEANFPRNGYYADTQTLPGFATTNMSKFQNAGVSTIIWAGGVETKQSAAANQLGYTPEWVLLGDGLQEAISYGQGQDQSTWSHAWTFTPTVRVVPAKEQVCYQAYREVDPSSADSDASGFACLDYDNLRQLFTGIQVAGPKLGPFSIDKGFHAIPSVESPDPRLPACYYEPADYTCVKDMTAMWWDRNDVAPGASQPGCYRMAQGGKRYRTGTWPEGDIGAAKDATKDPCNVYDATQFINNRAPQP
jgi:hypothetical protein